MTTRKPLYRAFRIIVSDIPTSLIVRITFSNTGGKYVYAERKSRGQTKTKSRLVSHRLCGSKCVELFYFTRKFMNTESELRLSARIDGKEDRLWFTNGAETRSWTRAVVDVKAEDTTCFEVRS